MEGVNKKLVLVLIVIGIISGIFIWQNISDNKIKLEIVSLNNETKSSSMFAIMLEEIDEEGNSTYVESEDNTWPTDDTYVYDITKSGCMDVNGNKIENSLEYDLVNNIASVKTEKTSYCYLYFSKPINLYELCEGTENMSDCLIQREEQIYMVNNITDEITGGLYRYQGTKDKVTDNYICFGTSDQTECLSNTDKYLYRILGFDSSGYLKIIKQNVLPSTYSNNQSLWGDSTLHIGLNDTYFMNAVDENNDKLYIPVDWEGKIETWDWKYGHIPSSQYAGNGIFEYNIESSFANFVNAKIGLMYIHDYFLALSNTIQCGSGNIYCQNNWLYIGNHERIITSGSGDHVWTIQEDSTLWWYWWGGSYYVRPVFYLTDTTRITSGDGTETNPYIII